MKLWLLNNIKFGYKNNSKDWKKIQFDYFYNFFIPVIEKHYKKDDNIVITGNLFNSQDTVNTEILNECYNLLSKVSSISNIKFLVGQNDIPIINIFRPLNIEIINNIKVEENVKYIPYNKIIMQSSLIDNKIIITSSDILQNDLKLINNKIYCGYHDKKEIINNCYLLGTPFYFNENLKINGITIVDLQNNKELFMENNISPKFKELNINNNEDIENINESVINNNFVTLKIDKDFFNKNELRVNMLISKYNFKKITFINEEKSTDDQYENFNTIDELINKKIDDEELLEEYNNIKRIYNESYNKNE
jgi:hypothetical protein